jgi:K+-sensing histidine kinase KdpD
VRLPVRGDPVRLRQVLSNLLATRSSSPNGRRGRRVPPGRNCRHKLRFEVIDTGIGIGRAAGAPVPVLQPGRCLDHPHLWRHRPGLAICKRIIDLMHGRIGVSPRRAGLAFWFEIPLLKVVGDLRPARDAGRAAAVSPDDTLRQRVSASQPNLIWR